MSRGPASGDIAPSAAVSARMARVRQKDTEPEMAVRRVVHALGYRFRLHRKDLPGSPDLVFPKRRAIIFIHGCFWHRHPWCSKASTPKSNLNFWQDKFDGNVERDARKERELRQAGWDVLVIWECETKKPEVLRAKLLDFLGRR